MLARRKSQKPDKHGCAEAKRREEVFRVWFFSTENLIRLGPKPQQGLSPTQTGRVTSAQRGTDL
jgi:hypothetical protein